MEVVRSSQAVKDVYVVQVAPTDYNERNHPIGENRMSLDRLSEQYYTAAEARRVLGLTEHSFQAWVRAGKITKVILPGRRQGAYPKRDIDALALAITQVFEHSQGSIYEFSRSTPGDQVEEMDIGIRCFGSEFITPLPERILFQQKSEYTFWSLKVSGRVVGYISMFRFPPAFLDDLLTGRRIERGITVKEVLPFTRGEPFDVYIDVLAVDPRLPLHDRRHYGWVIVSRFAGVILNLLSNGYRIETLYTVTATKEGDELVRGAGFHLMEGKSEAPGRIAYELPLDESGIEQLKRYSRRGA
jgi:hypothetical protein